MFNLVLGKNWDVPRPDLSTCSTEEGLKQELMMYLRHCNIPFEEMDTPTALVSDQTGKILTSAPNLSTKMMVFPVIAKTIKLPTNWKEGAAKMFADFHKEAKRTGKKCFIGLFGVRAVQMSTPYFSPYDAHMIRLAIKYY